MSNVIDLLKEFGLSTNASKAYISLLKNNPATGYEISSNADIPRSAVYTTLNKLEQIGIINSIGDSPKKYIPLAPSALLDHFEYSHKHRIEELEESFKDLKDGEQSFDFWHLYGYRNLILKMKEVIRITQKTLVMSLWKREVNLLEKELKKAEKRGVDVTLFSFTKFDFKIGKQISYNLNEDRLRKIWTPNIILVSDQLSTIMGSSKKESNSRSIFTKNEAIIEIAINHIVLDITLAGQRLNFDSNPIVKKIMKNADLQLNKLLKNKKTF